MTEHWTADEIRMKMRYAEPTLEQWRQRFDDLYRSTLLPTISHRLECLDLMQRAQRQLIYKPTLTLEMLMTDADKLKAALVILLKLRPYFKDPHDKRRQMIESVLKVLR
jgi:hypothetical protein